jgi:hypothetical protein
VGIAECLARQRAHDDHGQECECRPVQTDIDQLRATADAIQQQDRHADSRGQDDKLGQALPQRDRNQKRRDHRQQNRHFAMAGDCQRHAQNDQRDRLCSPRVSRGENRCRHCHDDRGQNGNQLAQILVQRTIVCVNIQAAQ